MTIDTSSLTTIDSTPHELCGRRLGVVVCTRPAGHDGPHECMPFETHPAPGLPGGAYRLEWDGGDHYVVTAGGQTATVSLRDYPMPKPIDGKSSSLVVSGHTSNGSLLVQHVIWTTP